MAKKNSKTRRKPSWKRYLLAALLLVTAAVLTYGAYLDWRVRVKFEGGRWALPARVFARPLELYQGQQLSAEQLEAELAAADYRRVTGAASAGSYERRGSRFLINTRGFQFPDGIEPAHRLTVDIAGGRVSALRAENRAVDLVRLDPALIGSIYPAHREDRVLVRLDEVPALLGAAVLAVEDREFYHHHGLSWSGIARAFVANLQAGRVVQGGSTITQQLVKNFYLSNERTLWRKANEAAMSLLLEARFGKDEILEAYFNEVYLGQDGNRSIHGFGLASRFYFGRPLQDLRLHEVALLAGLVKGPSYYDPRRYPDRARGRRDVVLQVLAEVEIITPEQARAAMQRPLGVIPRGKSGDTPYPAFMDLVKKHLQRDYRSEDLSSEGLRIFTTLDPWVQQSAERALATRLEHFGNKDLQGAVVTVSVDDGAVLGVVGGRDPRFPGFNRALEARRPVGSLIKPAVYLAALEEPTRFGLGTILQDEPITLRDAGGREWSPRNYNNETYGPVPLWQALARSYNLSTVQLGLDVGLRRVVDVMKRLGLEPPGHIYPSLLLGAVPYTPLEMAQMYHTIATGGFRSPLRSVRAVMTPQGEVLSRYPLTVNRAFESEAVYLLRYGLAAAAREGTARSVAHWVGSLDVAGKTGTTDDTRDSWFAGFTDDILAVTWLGRDDNGRSGLTGASGALTVWGELFARLEPRPLQPLPPEGVGTVWVEEQTGRLSAEHCRGARALPYVVAHLPKENAPCIDERGLIERTGDWLRGILN